MKILKDLYLYWKYKEKIEEWYSFFVQAGHLSDNYGWRDKVREYRKHFRI